MSDPFIQDFQSVLVEKEKIYLKLLIDGGSKETRVLIQYKDAIFPV